MIGGGVASAWARFIEPLRAEIAKRAFPEPAQRVKIIRATLGDDAGVLGAAKFALERLAA